MNRYAKEYLEVRREVRRTRAISNLIRIVEDIGFQRAELMNYNIKGLIPDATYKKIIHKLAIIKESIIEEIFSQTLN